jgi:ribonuclease HI
MPKRKSSAKFYAVAIGRSGSGIYNNWNECESQVKGYPNAKYKSFKSQSDANEYIIKYSSGLSSSSSSSSAATTTTATTTASSEFAFACTASHNKKLRINDDNVTTTTTTTTTIAEAVAALAAPAVSNNNNNSNNVDYDFYKDHDVVSKSAAGVAVAVSSSSKTLEKEKAGDDQYQHQHSDSDLPYSPPHKLWFHVMFDGGSRGNPNGHAGSGTHIVTRRFYNNNNENNNNNDNNDDNEKKKSKKKSKDIIHRDKLDIRSYLGFGLLTNNQAEYNGLVIGLEQILQILQNDSSKRQEESSKQRDVTIIIQGDSDLIIKQMNGLYQCKSPKLKSYFTKSLLLIQEIKKEIGIKRYQKDYDITFEHVYRDYNKIADGLANEAMDSKKSWMTTSTPSSTSSSEMATNMATKKKQSRGSTSTSKSTAVKPSNSSKPEPGLEV